MTTPPKVWWLTHEFYVFQAGNVTWKQAPGVYIFAGLDSGGVWRPLYVGQTNSLADRLANHPKWPEASQLGATHIHARVEQYPAERLRVESELIAAYQPRLNAIGADPPGS